MVSGSASQVLALCWTGQGGREEPESVPVGLLCTWGLWASQVISLSLSFLSRKMGIILPPQRAVERLNEMMQLKLLMWIWALSKCSING